MAADPIDERYDEIVRELRALPGAPAELRERVHALGSAADVRRPRRRGLTLAVAAGLLVVAAVAGIVLGSGGSSSQKTAGGAGAKKGVGHDAATVTSAHQRAIFAPHTKANALSRADGGSSIALPVNPARLTDVRASMRLRVSSLGNGDAYLTVRIPVAHVQQAVVRFTALGTIQSQHIAIRDLQDQANAEELRMQLTPEERVRLQSQLDAVRGLLRVKTQQHAGTLRQGRLSTFELELTTRKTAAAVPSKPGRIERAARHAFSALSKTIAGVLYALIVLSPLLVLVAAALWAGRYRRRRVEQRLLARA